MTDMIKNGLSWIGAAVWIMALQGCSMAPTQEMPELDVGSGFKGDSVWREAKPADAEPKGDWWKSFGDTELNALMDQLQTQNPSLQAALQRIEQARAAVDEGRAAWVPEISVGSNVTQTRTSSNSPGFRPGQTFTFWRAPLTLRYEADLWGRVRGMVASRRAEQGELEALQRQLMLVLQADVARHYFALRALDEERGKLDEAVDLRRKTLKLVEQRFEAGAVAELDVAQARTELSETETEAVGIALRRTQRENALAELCGKVPAALRLPVRGLRQPPKVTARVLPSTLLERRPDVAAAERGMAAANERIGVARTAYFPQIGLGIGGGFESAEAGKLFEGNSFLSSLSGGFEVPVIDGGLRKARLKRAWAEYEERAANYKEVLLAAFREVEDALAAVRVLRDQAQVQGGMVQAARRMVELSEKQYDAGLVSFLEVVIAQRALLRAEQQEVQLRGSRFEAAVFLVRAVGGGV